VAIDRTSWGVVNLLVVSLIVNNRAIPIYCHRLNKLGSSNLSEQQAVLMPVLALLKEYSLVILGDREFCSVKLAHWLRQQPVGYCLRLKRSEYVEIQAQVWVELKALGLTPGMSLFLQGVSITKTKGFGGLNLAAKWQLKKDGWSPEEGWFLVTSFDTVEAAVTAYRLRFDIEILQPQCPHKSETIDDEGASALTVFLGTSEHSVKAFKGIRKGQLQWVAS
jgi:hypothetical protein